MSFSQKCIGIISAFFITIILFSLTITVILGTTVLSPSYVSSVIRQTQYSNLVLDKTLEEIKDLVAVTGELPDSVFEDVITGERVLNDCIEYYNASFSGRAFTLDTADISQSLRSNIDRYLQTVDLSEIDITELNKNTDILVNSCMEVYKNNIQIKLLPTLGRYTSRFHAFLPYAVAVQAVLLLLLLALNIFVCRCPVNFIRYCIYSVLGCMLLFLIAVLWVHFSNVIPRLGISSKPLYLLVTTVLTRLLNYMWVAFGLLAVIVAALVLIAVKFFIKPCCRHTV